MDIREARPADIAAIVTLNSEVHDIHLRLFPDIFKPTDPAALAEWFGRLINDDKTIILVAEDTSSLGMSNIVAYLTLRKDERPAHVFAQIHRCAYIDNVCVTERYRGKGLFHSLLSKAEDIARRWGMSRLELDVWSDNAAAKKAFNQCGFQTYNEKMKLLIGE
jgi:ribosomal protein S18 acetylase RimI-like enzyme